MANKAISALTDLTGSAALTDKLVVETAAAASGYIDSSALLSLLPAPDYGDLYVDGGATAQSFSTTPTKTTFWAANGPSNGMTVDHTSDDMTIATTGIYLVLLQMSFSGTGNTVFEFHARVDGVEAPIGFHRKMSSGGDVGSGSAVGILSLTAGEVVTIYGESDSGGGENATVIDAHFTLIQIR